MGPDHNRQVTGWHEKSGGEHLEHIEFIVLLSFCYIHAAPRQGPPAPRSQGVISASVVVAPGQIFYAKFIQKPCI